MNIKEYVAEHSSDSVKTDIVERWESRIVANLWNTRGAAGAEAYLAQYGKQIKAPKVIGLARIAEIKGFPEMANRFWEEAFFLETGRAESLNVANGAAPLNEKEAYYAKRYNTRNGEASDLSLPAVPVLKQPFGHYPQLLVMVDRAKAMRLAADPAYGVQEKKDGERVMVKVRNGVLTAGNKKALVRPLPLGVTRALLALKRDFVIDGELVGNQYFPFDLISVDGNNMARERFESRYWFLTALIKRADRAFIIPVELAVTLPAKMEMIRRLEETGKEGFVIKKLSAFYQAGEMHGTQWKHQFRSVVACIVGERNGDKNSVEVFVKRTNGSLRSMGNVTVPNTFSLPKPGEIAEIENLYVHPGKAGKFAQAVFKGVRTDADENDCREDKLRVKAI